MENIENVNDEKEINNSSKQPTEIFDYSEEQPTFIILLFVYVQGR